MRRKTVRALALLVLAGALVALALLVGGAAGGNGHGKGGGGQSSNPGQPSQPPAASAHGNSSGGGGKGSTPSGQTGYHFLVLNQKAGTSDRMLIQGDGSFNDNQAHGGGTFDNFVAGTGPPANFGVFGTGTWKANDVVSWTPLSPTHGVYSGGTLVMHATFFPIGKAPIPNVMIAVYCNLGPAGVSTGHVEGIDVTFPNGTKFTPTTPTNTGVTIFTLAKREEG